MPMTDEDAALEAVETLHTPTDVQIKAMMEINEFIASDEPFINVQHLFELYDDLYFRSLLKTRVEASWSSRLTLCAGICELVKDPLNGNRYTKIRLKLSEPLLKFRPRSDVINTLLHEAIHAYFFVTTSWRHARGEDGSGHGPGFLLLSDAINNHGGYSVTVFHNFHDEVDLHRTHVWRCQGTCKTQAPFFGYVKRSMNRAPGSGDSWWPQHQQNCGGKYVKIAEPDMSKAQVSRLSTIQRAGLQKTKIDGWVAPLKRPGETATATPLQNKKRRIEDVTFPAESHKPFSPDRPQNANCPVCDKVVIVNEMNAHLDAEHFKST